MDTMLLYQIFHQITQSGVGNLEHTGLIMLQLWLSLFIEIKFLFFALKNKPPLVQIAIAMLPMVLVATYSIGCGIIFSAFLGKGPTLQEITELVNLTLSKQCISEMMIAVGAFFLLTLIYSMAYKLKPLEWLVTFGLETLAALALFALYGGLLVENFPYTILDLCERNLYLARWPIYGYFIVLFKCVVLIISLFLGFILRERKEKSEHEEESREYYERKTLKYLGKDNILTGSFFLLFSVAAEAFFLWSMTKDSSIFWNLKTIFTVCFMCALPLVPGAFGVALVYRGLFPQTSLVYRQLLAMGNRERILRLFCEEIVDGGLPEITLQKSSMQIQTKHFLFWRQSIRSRIEWREDANSGQMGDSL